MVRANRHRPERVSPAEGKAPTQQRVHASCVVWLGRGLLLCGPSGAGKSDLALRLIEAGASLVADDLVGLRREGSRLQAETVALPGSLEIRGIGLFQLSHLASAPLDAAIEVGPAEPAMRLPEPRTIDFLGIELPVLRVDPARPSAVAALRMALVGRRLEIVA
jgi:HPr kinase/phosphorylase